MAKVEPAKKIFEWSLKPLDFITKFSVGFTFNVSNNTHVSIRLILFAFGCFIILMNLLINGPRGLNINSFEWVEEIQNNERPLFSFFPDALLQCVVDVTTTTFWVSISLIHIIFLTTVLFSRKWTDLMQSLVEIENEMQFSEEFYVKCRKHYTMALVIFLLVWYLHSD